MTARGLLRGATTTSGPLLAIATTFLIVSLLEVGFRFAEFDFERKRHAFNTVPIFYRQPIVPVGEAFFRRPGPDRWEGNVIDVMYRMTGGDEREYRESSPVIASYDARGFRNPDGLDDWDVAVVGDSFTELGFLAYGDLFTTRLGKELGLRVKNLGVSHTGTLTQTAYLREYGVGASTTDAILVFFEGNDFVDVTQEQRRVFAARASGISATPPHDAPTRLESLPKQTSILLAAYRAVTGARPQLDVGTHPFIRQDGRFNAYFLRGDSRTAISIERQRAPHASALGKAERAALGAAITGFGDTARALHLQPWLAFMPSKHRVLEGYLAWTTPDAAIPLPVGVPQLIGELADEGRMRFVDLTPALRHETAAGRLTYNTKWDTHLNQRGSHTVAHALAAALMEHDGASED